MIRPLVPLLFAVALAACGRGPNDVDVDMETSAVGKVDVDRALDQIRNICRPLFSRHASDVTRIRATVADEGNTQARRFGWGVYISLIVDLKSSPTTLAGEIEPQAHFLAGGGARPGLLAFSPTAAALCDQPLAEGRRNAFLPARGLAEDLPQRVLNPTREQIAAYRAEEARALAGDYQSQRNIAWCWVDGCYGVEPIDDVQACAWRIVIAAARHPKSDASDQDNVRIDCDQALTPDDRAQATEKAQKLFQKIYKRPLP
ncbi:MAG: hypothetical protein LWW93_05080 [Hyphomicrobiales bacterium]|nr:hypothetical protein [Hyphomicrobiales bacterium]